MTLKIALLNDIHVGKPLTRNDKIRAASHLVEESLPQVLAHIERQHTPHLMINLGDLIRGENHAGDLTRYKETLKHFKKVPCPVIHLIGNHELKHLTVQEIERVWHEEGFDQKSYGMLQMEG